MLDQSYSFIIPVYNTTGEYLSKCVSSCLFQQNAEVEVVLVDDGSERKCSEFCDMLSKSDYRINVIHQKNEGVSAARNRGINEACGEWIICVDSDDWVEPTLCEVITDAKEKNSDIDFVIFSLVREYGTKSSPINGMYESKRVFGCPEELMKLKKDVLEHPLQNNILVFPYCKAVKKSVLLCAQPVFPKGLSMCEDVVSAFKLFEYVNKGVYFDIPLYHYRQTIDSAVYKYRPRADKEQMQLLSILKTMIDEQPYPQTYEKGYNREVLYSAQRIFSHKYYHRDSPFTRKQKREACISLFLQEPYKTGLINVDVNGLSTNHRLKCFLLRNRLYELCSILYRLYYALVAKGMK